MAREAFYVKPKTKNPILDALPAINQKAKVARMVGLSNNLDGVRPYGFTASFYHPVPHLQVLLEGENIGDKIISRFSLAVKSIDLPDFSAKVSHMSMLGMSGQSINYHVDKKFKLKVDELSQDALLHKLRQVGLLHQLGDSESQEASFSKTTSVQQSTISLNKTPRFTAGVPNPIAIGSQQVPFFENSFQKTPHYSFDLRLAKHLANGELHSVLDFIDCKIVGFKQSTFDYKNSNTLSEIDFEIVFDQLLSVPANQYADKTPKEVLKLIDDYPELNKIQSELNKYQKQKIANTLGTPLTP